MADNHLRSLALVTGATGFIGARLAERLCDTGRPVRVLVRDGRRLPPTLTGRCEVVIGDLGDAAALLSAVEGADVIFHCAANVRTWDCWDSYRAANVDGVRNLLHAISSAAGRLSRLVHVSTIDVYGFPREPCSEERVNRPVAFGYGESKRQGEAVVRDHCDGAGIPYTIIRPCNVIGPQGQFITRIGNELASGLMVKIDGGREHCGFVYIDNLIDCLIWAAGAETAIGQCFNIRDDCDVSWSEFLTLFRAGIDSRGLVLSLPFPVADLASRPMEWAYRIFLPDREPLLHPLIVRIFGRTCGHSIDKARRAGAPIGAVGFPDAMARSIAWFARNRTDPSSA